MIKSSISHYKIIDKLGSGGMGEVYKAEDTILNRPVAIKFLPDYYNCDEEFKKRFIREAQAASKLDHPNICTVHEINETDEGQLYIVLGYYEGETLDNKISSGKIDINEATDITRQIAEGLKAAHQNQIIHRDIKPSNIIVTDKGIVKILDFGLAKIINESKITRYDNATGTIAYMSPEQAKGEEADERTDIWSLGVILYEMLMGTPPFKGEYEQAIIYSILNENINSLSVSNSKQENIINDIILQCLKKIPDDRFKNLDEVIEKIEEINIQKISIKSKNKFNNKLKVFIVIISVMLGSSILIDFLKNQFFIYSSINVKFSKQLTLEPGIEIDPSISPDGNTMAYVKGPLGNTDIFIRQISGGREINLTKNLPGSNRWPKWKPDGNYIAFQSQGKIYQIPSLGGIPKLLVAKDSTTFNHSLTWSPDGEKIAFVKGNKVFMKDITSGDERELFTAYNPHSLAWSPNGEYIVYVSGNLQYLFGLTGSGNMIGNIAPSSIWLYSLKEKSKTIIARNDNLNMSPIWLVNSNKLLFISEMGGGRDIYMVNISSNGKLMDIIKRISTGLNIHTISVSSDGKKILYSDYEYISNIWKIKYKYGKIIPISEAQQITIGKQTIEGFSISKDGKKIAFDSDRNNNLDLFIMPIGGGEIEQITYDSNDDCYPYWSPDGNELCFHSFRNGYRNIFTVNILTNKITRVTNSKSQDREPHWVKNKIYFISDRNGTENIYSTSWDKNLHKWKYPKKILPVDNLNYTVSGDAKIIYNYNHEILLYDQIFRTNKSLYNNKDSISEFFNSSFIWLDNKKELILRINKKRNSGFWQVSFDNKNPIQIVKFDSTSICTESFKVFNDYIFFTLGQHESDLYLLEID